jgi:hypothetical protein
LKDAMGLANITGDDAQIKACESMKGKKPDFHNHADYLDKTEVYLSPVVTHS